MRPPSAARPPPKPSWSFSLAASSIPARPRAARRVERRDLARRVERIDLAVVDDRAGGQLAVEARALAGVSAPRALDARRRAPGAPAHCWRRRRAGDQLSLLRGGGRVIGLSAAARLVAMFSCWMTETRLPGSGTSFSANGLSPGSWAGSAGSCRQGCRRSPPVQAHRQHGARGAEPPADAPCRACPHAASTSRVARLLGLSCRPASPCARPAPAGGLRGAGAWPAPPRSASPS